MYNDRYSNIFICSDSNEDEYRLKNILSQKIGKDKILNYTKNDNVVKRDSSLSWFDMSNNYNVYRGKNSVINAVIDACILKTCGNYISNSPYSTYLILLNINL